MEMDISFVKGRVSVLYGIQSQFYFELWNKNYLTLSTESSVIYD